jgi:uncharacterized membrane protein
VLGTAAMLPFYLAAGGTEHLFHATASTLGWQLLGQGVVGGLVMFVAYGRTVVLLGPAQAGLFPSFVPCFAVLFGIPFLGELPTLPQLAGLVVVTFGILTAVGLVPPPRLGKADRGGRAIGEAGPMSEMCDSLAKARHSGDSIAGRASLVDGDASISKHRVDFRR